MTARQGDLALFDDPVAQSLLQAPIHARLAYTWLDGPPRVVPLPISPGRHGVHHGGPSGTPQDRALAECP